MYIYIYQFIAKVQRSIGVHPQRGAAHTLIMARAHSVSHFFFFFLFLKVLIFNLKGFLQCECTNEFISNGGPRTSFSFPPYPLKHLKLQDTADNFRCYGKRKWNNLKWFSVQILKSLCGSLNLVISLVH